MSFMFRERTVLVEAASVAARVIAVRTVVNPAHVQANLSSYDALATARYQQAIEAAKIVTQNNGLNPAYYNFRLLSDNYADGSPVVRVIISSDDNAPRFVIMPDTLPLSKLCVIEEAISYSPLGTPGLTVVDGNNDPNCTG